ncbi:hypothetical protein HZS_5654 [Henneguya salminicola]|nr:hypothetical protein HZS_5654 [Henneguya salminicola]
MGGGTYLYIEKYGSIQHVVIPSSVSPLAHLKAIRNGRVNSCRLPALRNRYIRKNTFLGRGLIRNLILFCNKLNRSMIHKLMLHLIKDYG